ncbi:MAG: UvrD-helicase domain-containing protein, partial [Ignavibacteriales bacterium]
MVKRAWTPQQREAIHARGTNLLVSAAAGAGKTSVLVQRIINCVQDPISGIDIDRLLVVTFTNAAAAQMREQIARELAAELSLQPSSRHLQRQITLLNCAPIATIHSFCLDVLRQHFYRLDLDPAFRVADDGEASLLELEVLEELFETKYQEENNQEFLNLVDAYGGERDDAGLMEIVLRIYRFARSLPWYDHWLYQAADQFVIEDTDPLEIFPWCETLKEHAAMELQGSIIDLQQALRLCLMPGGPAAYYDTIAGELQAMESLERLPHPNWEELYQGFQPIEFGRLKAVKKNDEVDKDLQNQVKGLRDGVKKQIGEIKRTYFERHPKEYLGDLKRIAPLMKSLMELVLELDDCFSRAKMGRGIVDFSDLEHLSLRILLDEEAGPGQIKPSPVALDLQTRFREVLVDEYQDVNAVQETILQLVSKQGIDSSNLFMVGDVKQSIYRFRQADPGLFLAKYNDYPMESDGFNRRINLRENFRSRDGIVDGINYLFRRIMSPRVGEMAYNEEAELVCGAQYPPSEGDHISPQVEIFIIDNSSDTNGLQHEEQNLQESGEQESQADSYSGDEETEEQLNAYQIEARLAARRIQQMISERQMVWDAREDRQRPVRYSDMAILMRATREAANVFVNEFRGADIPVYADLGTGYFGATEVETLLSLLKVIDNPQQDIPLVAVLRSPLVGLDAEQL